MKQLFTLLLFTSFIFLEAKMLDGIAFVVEGEAITTAEIRAVQTQTGVDKAQAIELLIQDRLQKSAMKDIVIDEKQVDKKIEEIATQNHVTIPKMQKILKQSGTSWVTYRASIKEALQKEYFFQKVVSKSIPEPSEDDLKLFYKKHKKEFTLPAYINLVEYSSTSKEKIDNLIKKHQTSLLNSKYIKKQTKDTNEALLAMLLSTPNGKYTKSINAGDKYIVYKVVSKGGKIAMSFENAKTAITSRWRQQQQSQALKDYFKKLKTRADIQKLR